MFGEIDSVETRHSKSKLGLCPLPITFWTDLGYKELPSVILTEGSSLYPQKTAIRQIGI